MKLVYCFVHKIPNITASSLKKLTLELDYINKENSYHSKEGKQYILYISGSFHIATL